VALGVVRHDDELLLVEGYDSVKDEHFLRFIGGGIEFGETAAQAVVREFEEELGVAVEAGQLLGVIENIFTYEAERGHEILFLFDVAFSDEHSYERAGWTLRDSKSSRAGWWANAALRDGPPLYPTEALDLVTARPEFE
jgi:ADP-ribose pyrophosphatase YjhB (NUDIX family)